MSSDLMSSEKPGYLAASESALLEGIEVGAWVSEPEGSAESELQPAKSKHVVTKRAAVVLFFTIILNDDV
jgi:hypothetical protein